MKVIDNLHVEREISDNLLCMRIRASGLGVNKGSKVNYVCMYE